MLSFNKFFIWRKITSCDLVDLLLNLFRLIYFYEGKAAIYKHLVKKKYCGGALWARGAHGPLGLHCFENHDIIILQSQLISFRTWFTIIGLSLAPCIDTKVSFYVEFLSFM